MNVLPWLVFIGIVIGTVFAFNLMGCHEGFVAFLLDDSFLTCITIIPLMNQIKGLVHLFVLQEVIKRAIVFTTLGTNRIIPELG